jgi:hypothetical protein
MTETDLANTALTLIAHPEITSIDDVTTEVARTCKRLYSVARDAALRAAHWNCATTRRTLAHLVSYEQNEWDYVYQLPQDPYCLKARRFQTSDHNWRSTNRFHPDYRPYRVEGRFILTNIAEPVLIYTRRITDVNLFDAELFQATATLLGAHLALAIRQDYKRNLALLEQWQFLRDEAAGVDESEGGKDTYISTDLISDR